jgi:hypothetical protein
MKTFAELKRALKPGTVVTLIERNGEIRNDKRTVKKCQTNAVCFTTDTGKDSWLTFPPASLVTIEGDTFTFHADGLRPLTVSEKEILDNQPRDAKQEELDCLSDGNTMYYRRCSYFKGLGAEYMQGTSKNGKCLVWDKDNNPLIRDASIKGTRLLVYKMG